MGEEKVRPNVGGRGKPVLISSVDGGSPGLPENINIFSDIYTMFMCILKSDEIRMGPIENVKKILSNQD